MNIQEVNQKPNSKQGIAVIVCGNEEVMSAETLNAVEAANDAMFDHFGGFINCESDFSAWNGGYCYQHAQHLLAWVDRGVLVASLELNEDDEWELVEPRKEDLNLVEPIAAAYTENLEEE